MSVPDYPVGVTLDFKFTTRQFTTGAPFAFDSGAVEVYEDNDITQITVGDTLTLEFDGVTGLHNIRIVATGGNGFEAGKSYSIVVSAGTVDSVSVVGEVIQQFTLDRSAAAVDLANGTDGLGAIKTETALIVADTNELQGDDIPTLIADVPTVSEFNARTLVSASYFDPAADTVATVTTVTNQITAATMADAIWDETLAGHVTADTAGLLLNDWQDGGRLDLILDIIAVDTTTDIPALIATAQSDLDTITGAAGAIVDSGAATVTVLSDAVWDEDATAHQTQGTFGQAIGDPAADADTIYGSVVTGAAGANIAVDIIAVKAETALIVADTNELQTDDVPGLIAALNDPTIAAIADGVWDETLAGHVTADTSGLLLNEWQNGGRLDLILDIIAVDTTTDIPALIAAVQSDTDDIQTRLPGALVGGLMDSNVGAISADTVAADNLELFIEGTALGTLPQVDTQQINAANVVGDGNATPWDGA